MPRTTKPTGISSRGHWRTFADGPLKFFTYSSDRFGLERRRRIAFRHCQVRMQAGAAGILTNFVGGRHGVEIGNGSAKEQADIAVRELVAIYPGISAARSGAREARFHWPSHPWTLGSYACFRPGQWTTLRGAIGEPVGNLYFAGEHCAFDNQGFMEGGVETGEWAAKAITETRAARAA